MLLVINAAVGQQGCLTVDTDIARITTDIVYTTIHINTCSNIPDLTPYKALLISGSEHSAAAGSNIDAAFNNIARHFVDRGLPAYGICWGHQMLVKLLAGAQYVRKATVPEFGYRKIELSANPLFSGLEQHFFMQSHMDEVTPAPGFKVIASGGTTQVQAVQHTSLPVWGTQFHPELIYEEGMQMMARVEANYPQYDKYRRQDTTNPDLTNNGALIRNFYRLAGLI